MAVVPNAVPAAALDYDEIFRRGGANCGDEDFALCKCPHCGYIYLMEYEVETLYLDSSDLSRRAPLFTAGPFPCVSCAADLPDVPWIGPDAPKSMQVTWSDLRGSAWRWITAQTRDIPPAHV